MNLLIYVVLLLIVSYPQIEHIKIMTYMGLGGNGQLRQIQSSNSSESTFYNELPKKLDMSSNNTLNIFKDEFLYKLHYANDFRKSAASANAGDDACIYYCFYETWYGIKCSSDL